jgi:hypothetical protein
MIALVQLILTDHLGGYVMLSVVEAFLKLEMIIVIIDYQIRTYKSGKRQESP